MMKKFFFIFAGLVLALASCSDGSTDTPDNPNPKPDDNSSITLDDGIITGGVVFDNQSSEKSVSFTTTKDWTLSIAATTSGSSWCTASASSGTKGSAMVKFSVTENSEYDDRSVSVTIKAGTASKTFSITQKSAEGLLVTTNKFEVAQEGGTIEVEVKANIDYQLEIAESSSDWISEAKTRGLTAKTHKFSIAASEETEKREGEIYVKSGDKKEVIKVYQAGGAILMLSKDEIIVSDAGETISVDIKSNFEFAVQMPEVDWIVDEASTRGMSSHTLNYKVLTNETYDSRSAQIIFYDKSSSLRDTLNIIQAQKNAIILSQKEVEVDHKGGTISVLVNSNVDFTTTIDASCTSWISLVSTRSLVESKISLNIQENNSDEGREGYIIFSDGKTLCDTVKVVQRSQIAVIYTDNEYSSSMFAPSMKLIGKTVDWEVLHNYENCDPYYNGFYYPWGNRKRLLDISEIESFHSYDYKVYYKECKEIESGLRPSWEWNQTYFIRPENPEGIITPYCFYTYNVESLILPKCIKEIEPKSFVECYINNIVISEGMTSIGKEAFMDSGIDSIGIPNSVKEIQESAFANSSLSQVYIPNSVETMGVRTFYNCQMLSDVHLSENLTEIPGGAFASCKQLTNINLHDRITTIGWGAFSKCINLAKIILPKNITAIGSSAFYGCTMDSITFPNSVKEIGESAFEDCTNLTNITIPNSTTWIGERAFAGCSKLAEATLNSGVQGIGKEAFAGCPITKITIPGSVKKIGSGAFKECTQLTEIVIEDGVTSIGESAFAGCPITKITIPGSVKEIGSGAFKDCTQLTEITIPGSVTTIGKDVFKDCTQLTQVVIENGVKNIKPAFSGCSNLARVTIPGSATIQEKAFWDCNKLSEVVFLDSETKGVGTIGKSAFAGCPITSLTIPGSVRHISEYAFMTCPIKNLELQDGINQVSDGAFKGCTRLSSVSFPASATIVRGFEDCTGLTNIDLPEGVTMITRDAFKNCKSLRKITLPSTVIWLAGFQGCSGLTEIKLNEGIKEIEKDAFCNCSSLTSISIPKSVKKIEEWAFFGCNGLTSISIPESVEEIQESAFNNCKSLKEFSIHTPTQIKLIGNFLHGCYSLEKLYIYSYREPEGEKLIFEDKVINNCTLYIPRNRMAYQYNYKPWTYFKEIIEME